LIPVLLPGTVPAGGLKLIDGKYCEKTACVPGAMLNVPELLGFGKNCPKIAFVEIVCTGVIQLTVPVFDRSVTPVTVTCAWIESVPLWLPEYEKEAIPFTPVVAVPVAGFGPVTVKVATSPLMGEPLPSFAVAVSDWVVPATFGPAAEGLSTRVAPPAGGGGGLTVTKVSELAWSCVSLAVSRS
jgi:hypothetical protein